jgi:nitroreductase
MLFRVFWQYGPFLNSQSELTDENSVNPYIQKKLTMQKSIEIEHPVSEVIKKRKSVRAYSDRLIETQKINSLFEAVRWAPSSSNGQPWLYLYATKEQPELWNNLFDCLLDGNKIWAKDAPLLMISLARKNFIANDKPNHYAFYDLGAANAFLAIQAVELGLQLRQMGGYDPEKAKLNLNIPDSYHMGAMIAVGYPGDVTSLPENLRLRELAPRDRFVQQEFVLNNTF